MKKFYFLAAVALASLASCTNEETVFEPQASREISFQAVATNSTRSIATTENFAAPFYVASAYQPAAGESYSNLFASEGDFVAFVNNGSNVWKSSTLYYYPAVGTVDFMAYATGSAANGDEVIPAATLTRGAADGSISNLRLDYTAADHQLAGKTDVMYTLNPGLTCPQTGSVKLEFQHALAWLSITMDAPENTVKITSLKVNNVSLTGVLDVAVANHALATPALTWTPSTPVAEVPFSAYCPDTPTYVENLIQSPEGILVVPGGTQTQLTLVYQLQQNPGVDITRVIDLADYGTWEPGMHYIYSISFNSMNVITFQCEVGSYGSVTQDDIKP